MCAHAVRVSIRAINGVDTVNVSLAKGLASVTMKPGNTATLKQMHEAIAKNGFTMKQSEVTVRGEVVNDGGKLRLKVSGTSDVLDLMPEGPAVNLSSAIGKLVEITGTLPEAAKNQVPSAVRARSIGEVK